MKTLMTIGHRESKLISYPDINSKIISYYTSAIEDYQPEAITTSLTPGADFLLAETAYILRIPYSVYTPYTAISKNFSLKFKKRYSQLIRGADEVHHTSKKSFTPKAVNDNLSSMVNSASKCLFVWDGSPGIVKNYVMRTVKTEKFLSIFNPKTTEIITR